MHFRLLYTFSLLPISENWISILEHVDCSHCSPLDTLLGSGMKLVEFPRFALLRCLVSSPFRPDA